MLPTLKANSVQPSAAMCGAILTGCDLQSTWRSGLSLLSGELDQDDYLDEGMCSSAAAACKQQGRWQWALQVWRRVPPEQRGRSTGITTSSLGQAMQWPQGLDILSSADSARLGRDVSTWDAALSSGEEPGSHWHRALALLANARERLLEATGRSLATVGTSVTTNIRLPYLEYGYRSYHTAQIHLKLMSVIMKSCSYSTFGHKLVTFGVSECWHRRQLQHGYGPVRARPGMEEGSGDLGRSAATDPGLLSRCTFRHD